jgi:hypothetical protein
VLVDPDTIYDSSGRTGSGGRMPRA